MFLLNGSGNPSSQYPYGAAAKKRLEADRAVIAAALGCKPDELYFTSCGTESDNWAIRLAAHQNRRVGKHIITTAVEHSAVLEPCRQLEQEGYAVTYLAPDRQGNITAQQVADALREDTALVSVMLVNNETGCVFPVGEIARLLRERGSKALLHTDAVQAFLKLPFRADTLGADLISVSGHKLNAPKGVGALYIGPRCRAVRPLLAGGGQERGLRSGTEATAQIAGFAKAVELRLEGYEEKLARMAQLKQYALEQLLTIDGVVRIGNGDAPAYPLRLARRLSERERRHRARRAGHLHLRRLGLPPRQAQPRLRRDEARQKDGRRRSARQLRARNDARGDRRACIRAPQA